MNGKEELYWGDKLERLYYARGREIREKVENNGPWLNDVKRDKPEKREPTGLVLAWRGWD